jgi:methyl-accepting chemotaxis protein
LALLVVGLIIVRQVMTLRENVALARSQAGALRMLAEANAYNFEHARELEIGLQHLSAVQARIAQGDFSARVPVLHGTTLFPVTSMLNLMLERVESRMRASQQSEQVAALALRLAEICRSAEAGDWSALQVLAQPSGTALDPIARVVASLQRRVAEQGTSWPSSSQHPWMGS